MTAPVITGWPYVGNFLTCTDSASYQWYAADWPLAGRVEQQAMLRATELGSMITCKTPDGVSNALGPVSIRPPP
jgi:hypothetical protein